MAYTGLEKDNALLTNLPAELTDGSVRVVDIAASSQNAAAIDENGKIWVWGVSTHGEKAVPEMESKPVKIYGGRYHYTVLLENGDVVAWGDDQYGQASVPGSVEKADIAAIYAGGNQNYAVTKDGKVLTWGLKGFLCGTDDLGRDVLARIVNGGKMTMTVGAIAVIISTIIGLVLGGIARLLWWQDRYGAEPCGGSHWRFALPAICTDSFGGDSQRDQCSAENVHHHVRFGCVELGARLPSGPCSDL